MFLIVERGGLGDRETVHERIVNEKDLYRVLL